MSTGDHEVHVAWTAPDKRRASSDLDDTAQDYKKIRHQAVDPQVYEEAAHTLPSNTFAALTQEVYDSSNLSTDDILITLDGGANGGDVGKMGLARTESIASEVEHNTCFGVVMVNATSSFFRDKKTTGSVAVEIRPCGDFAKIFATDTGKYAGIVTEPAVSKLMTEHSTKLTGALIAQQSPNGKASKKIPSDSQSKSMLSLRIVVYGLMHERYEVGKLLSKANLYLQQPVLEDVDVDIEYFNPHYLLRPGSQMPRLEDLEINDEDRATSLDETTKRQLMGIFDSAGDLGIKPTTEPSRRLQTVLKQHQITALTVMSEKECLLLESSQCPSLWESFYSDRGEINYRHRITGEKTNDPPLPGGGILADEMGLGKTLSILSLICWSLDMFCEQTTHAPSPTSSLATLIVAPKSIITEWNNQINKHIIPGQIRIATYHGPSRHNLASQFQSYDVILTNYQTLQSDFAANGPLFSEWWFRVVLDEAHRIGNRATQTFRAACELQSTMRWCLTGTPIVNTLDNYAALLSFVRVAPFYEKSKFDYWLSKPVRDKTPYGLRNLRLLVGATCLRRTNQGAITLSCQLPSKREKIEKVPLHLADRHLYECFKVEAARLASGKSPLKSNMPSLELNGEANILTLINMLRRICNHGEDLLPTPAIEAWKKYQSELPSSSSICSTEQSCASCHCNFKSILSAALKTACGTCSPKKETGPPSGAKPPSAKILALIRNLLEEQAENRQGHLVRPVKSVVFSYWTKMLDLIYDALQERGFSCQRFDGQRSLQQRSNALQKFTDDPTSTVMLATIGSAGEGINLTAASCVHLMEPHWNPMAEEQAIARVHRIGQLRDVTTTRYITPRSIEEYVQQIQQKKLELVQNVLVPQVGTPEHEIDEEMLRRFLDLKDGI
ncbi:SNF2 family N-terminal domain-containing protein [Mariannaea sp. PMI_226]|nr:SNF2 family N-terminal domain-containing protein [Mariannaea sp. PMI_226]